MHTFDNLLSIIEPATGHSDISRLDVFMIGGNKCLLKICHHSYARSATIFTNLACVFSGPAISYLAFHILQFHTLLADLEQAFISACHKNIKS